MRRSWEPTCRGRTRAEPAGGMGEASRQVLASLVLQDDVALIRRRFR
jgi:hypothetical protein